MTDVLFSEKEMDIVINTNGQLQLTQNRVELIQQRVRTALRTFQGEWFLNRTLGLPYFQEILTKVPDNDYITFLITQTIKEVEGIEQVTNIVVLYDPLSRMYSYEFTARIEGNNETIQGVL